jgi:hypothetical protein
MYFDDDDRFVPDVWARLASIPRLADLRKAEQQALCAQFLKALRKRGHSADPAHGPELLELAHRFARAPLFGVMYSGKERHLKHQGVYVTSVRIENGIVRKKTLGGDKNWESVFARWLDDLFVADEPPPFLLCPECRSVIFVPKRTNQRHCSRKCTVSAVEKARVEQKRKYMKRYMAKRRAKERRKMGGAR